MSHPAEKFIITRTGPMGTVRYCTLCKKTVFLKRAVGWGGRGYGMKWGNKARGEMIQHVKAEHPEKLK